MIKVRCSGFDSYIWNGDLIEFRSRHMYDYTSMEYYMRPFQFDFIEVDCDICIDIKL